MYRLFFTNNNYVKHIDDLNIRGATAFIHLVQNVDEFEQAVSELANSQGAANKMGEVQQGSLEMQVQLLRNAAKEVFKY